MRCWSLGTSHTSCNHWQLCFCHRRPSILEQFVCRTAFLPDFYLFLSDTWSTTYFNCYFHTLISPPHLMTLYSRRRHKQLQRLYDKASVAASAVYGSLNLLFLHYVVVFTAPPWAETMHSGVCPLLWSYETEMLFNGLQIGYKMIHTVFYLHCLVRCDKWWNWNMKIENEFCVHSV